MSTIHTKIKSVVRAVLGTEGFENKEDVVIEDGIVNTILAGLYLGGLAAFLIYAVLGYGAANLSYCYNIAIGSPQETAYMFAALCFLFPYIYYPYYAIMLNPLCKKTNLVASVRK